MGARAILPRCPPRRRRLSMFHPTMKKSLKREVFREGQAKRLKKRGVEKEKKVVVIGADGQVLKAETSDEDNAENKRLKAEEEKQRKIEEDKLRLEHEAKQKSEDEERKKLAKEN